MELVFKKREQTGSLDVYNTVAEQAGVGGSYELSSVKNFKGTLKGNGKLTNVTIRISNKKGESVYVNCSEALSKELRSSTSADELQERIDQLATKPIYRIPQVDRETDEPILDENGEQIIIFSIGYEGSADMSETRVKVTANTLKKESVARTISFEDLVALG